MGTKYDENAKLWTNVDKPLLSDVNSSSSEWIWKKLLEHGSKVAQINDDTGAQMTFSELRLKSIRAAQNLQKIGFRSHEKFCFMTINNENLLPIVLASIGLACPICPLFPILSIDEIVRILTKIKPSALFCDANLYDQMNEAMNKLQFKMQVFLLDDVHVDGVETVMALFHATGEESSFVPVEYDLKKDPAGILSSSGTTGPSKSVCVSYGNHAYLPFEIDTERLVEDCVLFTCDSIYWNVGFKPLHNSIYHGAVRIITSKPFTPELQLRIIDKYKVTVLFNTPFITAACLKSDCIHKYNLSSVKRIYFYGAKLPNTLVPDINHYFPNADLVMIYGLTEAGLVSTNLVNAPSQGHFQNNINVNGGQLFNGCSVKIIDDAGNRWGPNCSGEICAKNEHQFINYLDDSAATASAVDSEGFFLTGDIGHFDDNGNLFVEDRKKFVANVFYFENILVPSTIEECLIKLAGVLEVCVVAVPLACDECLPAAAIIRDPKSNLDPNTVFNVVAENFPNGLKLRAGVYFVESLPKTPSGKFIRKQVTDVIQKLFNAAKENDPILQGYLSDIPDDYKRLI